METGSTKICPYCKETIQAEAVLCRYCRSRLSTGKTSCFEETSRDLKGRLIAGVCAYLALVIGAPVALVRIGFLVLAFLIPPVGLGLYLAIWAVVPFREEERSLLERLVKEICRMIARFRQEPERWPEKS